MLLEKLLTTFAPVDCLRCKVEGRPLCPDCLPAAFDIVPSRCFLCKTMTENYKVCAKCRKQTALRHVWVGTIYAGLAKQIIHELKFRPDRTVGYTLARWLNETLSYVEADVVTHIPTAQTRVRQRGFDHAKIMARDFAKYRNLTYKPLLLRRGSSRQVGSEKRARALQIAGAYTAKCRLESETVLLIDDITTTGATLSEAARTLKKSGAREVNALAFAQAI
jgi:ComF family protein